jgi:hypothetical protein
MLRRAGGSGRGLWIEDRGSRIDLELMDECKVFGHLRKNPVALASGKFSTYVSIEARMRLEAKEASPR